MTTNETRQGWGAQINASTNTELFETLDRLTFAEFNYGALQADICEAIADRTELARVCADLLEHGAKDPGEKLSLWVWNNYAVDLYNETGRILFDYVTTGRDVGGL